MNEERAKLLLETFADCSGNMHEPDEQGFGPVWMVGNRLDNACGDTISVDGMLRGYQEALVVFKNDETGECIPFNLANLVAFARVGAQQFLMDRGVLPNPKKAEDMRTARLKGESRARRPDDRFDNQFDRKDDR